MRLVSADKSTGQLPSRPDDGGDGSTTRMLIRPVFTRGGDRRRRLLVRGGYLLAASSLAYLAMVLVSITASPAARPATDTAQDAGATTVRQVTPARPSLVPKAPVVAAPVTTVRARVPVATPVPPPASATPVVATPTAAAPTASASTKPTKRPRSGSASASKTSAPKTAAAVQPGGA